MKQNEMVRLRHKLGVLDKMVQGMKAVAMLGYAIINMPPGSALTRNKAGDFSAANHNVSFVVYTHKNPMEAIRAANMIVTPDKSAESVLEVKP